MLASEQLIDDLAGAVLDGAVVDWGAAESTAEGAAKPLVRHLRLVASVARLHRDVLPTETYSGALPAQPDAAIRDRWGHLKLFERAGRGAFGEVFRAWDTRLDREVALKLLPAPAASDKAAAGSIIREGRLLAKVRHPNVVTIYGAEQIGHEIGLWMEFVRGRTLEQLIKQGTAFRHHEVVTIGIELCGAVSAVHAAGLLHRDIKAQNVVRADDGRIVLMDFGTGKELDDSSAPDLAGTPLYLAPEVLRGEAATVQSDVFSVGVLLYHLLTGKYPVEGRTIRDLRAAHVRGARRTLKTARPDLPTALVRVIDRAIDPDPPARYQSAQALAADLKALEGASRARFLRYIASAAAMLVVAAGVALGTGAWTPFGRPTSPPRLAVLPFENLGAQPDGDAFVHGLTYEIQRHLSSLRGIQLLSFAASSAFPAKARNLGRIRNELDADLILAGSIFQGAGVLKITAELVQVDDGVAIWTDSFDRKASDVFAVQEEISRAIVDKLRLTTRWRKTYATRPELADLFLRARSLEARRDAKSTLAAAELYEQVVAGDPAFAPAWAGLAIALSIASRRAPVLDPNPRIEEAALKAMELDQNFERSQVARAIVFGRERRWDLAEKAFLDAIELNPSETETYDAYLESVLLPQGRFVDAQRVLTKVLSIDPSPYVHRGLALNQADLGHYEAAIAHARWVIDREPTLPWIHTWLARALYLSGQLKASLEVLQELPKPDAGDPGYLGHLYGRLGRRDDAEALAVKHRDKPAVQMLIYAGLGDRERTFEAFERTVAMNWLRALAYLHRPEIAPLIHDDPRVRAIVQKLGLPH